MCVISLFWIHSSALTLTLGGPKSPEAPRARAKWLRQLTKLVLLLMLEFVFGVIFLRKRHVSCFAAHYDKLPSSFLPALTLTFFTQDRYTSKMFLRGDSVILVLKNPH